MDEWVGKIRWRRKWQLTSVFLPGKSHGQKISWEAAVHSVAQSWTWLKRLSMHTQTATCWFFQVILLVSISTFIHSSFCCCSVTKSHLTPYDLMDCSLPSSLYYENARGRILEWVAISFSRGSSQPGIKPMSPALAGGFFMTEPEGKPQTHPYTHI